MVAKSISMVHQGEYLSKYEILYQDELTGDRKPYEIVSKQGSRFNHSTPLTLDSLGKRVPAITMVVFNQDHSKMLLTKEFRLGINKSIYNMTAGLIDEGETPEQAAKRELFEETGLTLTKIICQLPNSYTCAPVTDDFLPTFICEATGELRDSEDPKEVIHPCWYTKKEVLDIVTSNNISFSAQMQAFAYMWSTDLI